MWRSTPGRWFSDIDEERRASVIIIGHDTAEELFPSEQPLGEELDIDGQLFTVIGVAKIRKSVFGGGKNPDDNIVFFPLTHISQAASRAETVLDQRQGHLARRYAEGDG